MVESSSWHSSCRSRYRPGLEQSHHPASNPQCCPISVLHQRPSCSIHHEGQLDIKRTTRGRLLTRRQCYHVPGLEWRTTAAELNCSCENLLPKTSERTGITNVWGQLERLLQCGSFSLRQSCNQGHRNNRVRNRLRQSKGCGHEMSKIPKLELQVALLASRFRQEVQHSGSL